MPRMTPSQLDAFLARPLVAVLTTLLPDGALHSTPVWHEYDEGKFYVWVGSHSVKARNVARHGSASLCVATHEQPYQYVSAEGPCAIVTHDLAERCLSICRRYYSEAAAQAFVREDLLSGDSVILVLTPRKLLSERSA